MTIRNHPAIRHLGDERGAAMAMILLIGSALIALTGVMIARGVSQMGNTRGDTQWERSINVAEAGADYAINEKDDNVLLTTEEEVPEFGSRQEERDWVIAAAAAHPTVETPEGEFTFVIPKNQKVLYAVGYVPSRDAIGVRTRVVRREYKTRPYYADGALISGGDVDLGGNALTIDPEGNSTADVHANGSVQIGNNVNVDGCLTSSVTALPEAPPCPASPVPQIDIPAVRARAYYRFAEIALCPDGTVRGGPAHPSFPDPTPETPCDGTDTVVPAPAWKFQYTTSPVWSNKQDTSGVVYVYRSDLLGNLGKYVQGKKVEITIFTETGDRSCATYGGGNVELSAGSYLETHPSVGEFQTAIIAEGDVKYRGGATVIGAIFAREQVDYAGSPDSWGPVLAGDECDTVGSPVSLTSVTGGGVINFSGEVETLFEAGITPVAWDEL